MATFQLIGSSPQNAVGYCSGVKDFQIANIGLATGNVAFGLGKTTDSGTTVFEVGGNSMSMTVAKNDKDLLFYGNDLAVTFNQQNDTPWSVGIDSTNSTFDFSGTSSGAFVQTTESSGNNRVQLGGGSLFASEVIKAPLTASQTNEERAYNNVVIDSGRSNSFFSASNSQSKFTTTSTSSGAFVMGGFGNDTFDVGGKYGVFNGYAGYNIFTTAEAKTELNTSFSNVMIGGIGNNVVNDYGLENMYQGSYINAAWAGTEYEGINGADSIRMNGIRGIARADAEHAIEAPEFVMQGYFNSGFTGDFAETADGKQYSYDDIMNNRVANYERKDGLAWSLENFYSSNDSPKGYAASFGMNFLQYILK